MKDNENKYKEEYKDKTEKADKTEYNERMKKIFSQIEERNQIFDEYNKNNKGE